VQAKMNFEKNRDKKVTVRSDFTGTLPIYEGLRPT